MKTTEFYCNPSGSNVNGGSSSALASLCSDTNKLWDSTNLKYLGGAGNFASAASGMFCSVYTDGATVTGYSAMITSLIGTSGVQLSATIKIGTAPGSAATGISANVGGAWSGPSGSQWWPLNTINSNAASGGTVARVNMAGTYSVSFPLTLPAAGTIPRLIIQGMTANPGDSGMATIGVPSSGASILLMTVNQPGYWFRDMDWNGNGTVSPVNFMFTNATYQTRWTRCLFRGSAYSMFNAVISQIFEECEFYACNTQNVANLGVVYMAYSVLDRCYIHDCLGSNVQGVMFNGPTSVIRNTIFSRLGSDGIATVNSNCILQVENCDFYRCGRDGIRMPAQQNNNISVTNSNFISCSGSAMNDVNGNNIGLIQNCGIFNNLAFTGCDRGFESGSIVTYSQNPYNSPDNGDFSLITQLAKTGGKGTIPKFVNVSGSSPIPSIGAIQAAATQIMGVNRARIIGGF